MHCLTGYILDNNCCNGLAMPACAIVRACFKQVGDDAATAAFKAFWEGKAVPRGSRLVRRSV